MFKKSLFILIIFLTACQPKPPTLTQPQTGTNQDSLFQTSTISALLAGVYDGDLTIAELKEKGDFGLGTFDAVNGEMIVLDGQVYQVTSDGQAAIAADEGFTPFAAVTNFAADQTLSVTETATCADFRDKIDAVLPSLDEPYAIKVAGTFKTVKARAPHEQSKPYPPLTDVLAEQAVFDFSEVSGTMVGFRLPEYLENVNSTGYHFHFLTDDLQAGGHVLDCEVGNVQVEIDTIDELLLDFPQNEAFKEQTAVQEAAAEQTSIILGAIYNLTGIQAGLDIPSSTGAQLAIDEANQAGGVFGRPLQLIIADGASDPVVIAERSTALINEQPTITALMGLSDTDLVSSAAPVAAGNGRLFLTSGATSPKLPALEPGYLFLAGFGDNVQAAAGGEWAYNDLGARTVSILYNSESTYTNLLKDYFQTRLTELGGEVLSIEGYHPAAEPGDWSIAAAVDRLQTADLVYLAATPEEVLTAVNTLRTAGHQSPILGGDGLDVAGLWEGLDVGPVYYTTHAYLGADSQDPRIIAFREAYSAAYPDTIPDAFSALGYDAARLLITAIEQAGSSDPQAVRAALSNIQNFDGVTGQISYQDGSEIPSKSVSIIGTGDGKLQLIKQFVPDSVPAP